MKKLVGVIAVALTIVASPALACGTGFYATVGPCLPGAPIPGSEAQTNLLPSRPLSDFVPQTTYGSIGNQPFTITRWPNGMVTIDR